MIDDGGRFSCTGRKEKYVVFSSICFWNYIVIIIISKTPEIYSYVNGDFYGVWNEKNKKGVIII